MNYRIEAIEILLNEDCISARYYPLIPCKSSLEQYLKAHGIYSKDDCLTYYDDASMFFEDDGLKALFKEFLQFCGGEGTPPELKNILVSYAEPDFEGILICSDFDGTLYCGYIPERNMRAIKYFTDHGGIFTLVSGRNGKDIAAGRFPIPVHTVMAGLNGTQIYDVPNRKLIEQAEIGECGKELVCEILDALPEIRKMDIVSERGRITVDLNDTELYRQLMVDGYQPIYKAVFYMETEGENFFPEIAVKICEGRALVSSNGYGGFEITAPGASKGRAAKILKELTNAKTLICVGDFQSDVSMFEMADRSFAPSSASQIARNAATDIVCPVNEGVLGDIVEILSDDAGKISKENTKQISFNYSRGYSL